MLQSRIPSPSISGLTNFWGSCEICVDRERAVKASSSPITAPNPITGLFRSFSTNISSVVSHCSCNNSRSSEAPPPPRLQGCLVNLSRGTSDALTNSLCESGRSICFTIAVQTGPFAGSVGVVCSPLIPMTVRTVWATGGWCLPKRITVGVP